jgi:hypothetical protein
MQPEQIDYGDCVAALELVLAQTFDGVASEHILEFARTRVAALVGPAEDELLFELISQLGRCTGNLDPLVSTRMLH